MIQLKPMKCPSNSHHTLSRVISRLSSSDNDKFAIQQLNGPSLTNSQLLRLAFAIASLIADTKTHSAVLILERTPLYTASILACWIAGIPFIPIDPSLPLKRIELILRVSGALLVLLDESTCGMKEKLSNSPLSFNVSLVSFEKVDVRLPRSFGDCRSPAYICFTSGSTGSPKGVVVSHCSLSNVLEHFNSLIQFTEAKPFFLSISNFAFDISLIELLLPLTEPNGIALLSPSSISKSSSRLVSVLHERFSEIAAFQATPSMYRLLIQNGLRKSGQADPVLLCGGEAFTNDLKVLLEVSKNVFNCYGPTECTIWCAVHRINGHEKTVPIGKGIQNANLSVTEGELVVSGDRCLALGYLSESDGKLLRKSFPNGIYHTGDAVVEREGDFLYRGRVDDQIKFKGHRIEPLEIEKVIEKVKGIHRVVVKLQDDLLVAFIECEGQMDQFISSVRSICTETLPYYMIPSKIQKTQFKLSFNGKTDRSLLQIDETAVETLQRGTEKPSNVFALIKSEIENAIDKTLKLNTSLVEQGMQSLNALMLCSSLSDSLGCQIDTEDVFAHSTAASFIKSCISKRQSTTLSVNKHTKHTQLHPLLESIQKGDIQEFTKIASTVKKIDSITDRFGSSALHFASGYGRIDMVRLLVRLGADISFSDRKSGRQAIHWAARNGHTEVCQYLFDCGALIDAETKDGTTPLHLAAWNDSLEAFVWFIEKGADLHAQNKWKCFVSHFAALSGSLKVITYLDHLGFDLSVVNDQGHDALHKAAYGGHVKLCEFLIAKGLDIRRMDKRGQDCVALALKAGYIDCASFLDSIDS